MPYSSGIVQQVEVAFRFFRQIRRNLKFTCRRGRRPRRPAPVFSVYHIPQRLGNGEGESLALASASCILNAPTDCHASVSTARNDIVGADDSVGPVKNVTFIVRADRVVRPYGVTS